MTKRNGEKARTSGIQGHNDKLVLQYLLLSWRGYPVESIKNVNFMEETMVRRTTERKDRATARKTLLLRSSGCSWMCGGGKGG